VTPRKSSLTGINQLIDLPGPFIDAPNDVSADADHPTKGIFFHDYRDIERQVSRAWNLVRQRREKREPADCFELLLVLQPLLHGDGIDWLQQLGHCNDLLVNHLQAQIVKLFAAVPERSDALVDAIIGCKEDAANDALLGLQ
jgi:hypothetical protein